MLLKEKSLEKEFPRISIPNDIELVKKLQNKFKEYRKRISDTIERNQKVPQNELTDDHYKAFILERLLTEGEVDSSFGSELGNKFWGFLDQEKLKGSWAVIEDYAKTGGKGLKGGTGLK